MFFWNRSEVCVCGVFVMFHLWFSSGGMLRWAHSLVGKYRSVYIPSSTQPQNTLICAASDLDD